MKKWININWLFITACIAVLIILMFLPKIGFHAIRFSSGNLIHFLLRLPPIFILTGLLDVWISQEQMARLMGSGSGIKGAVISLFMGMLTAVPIYALLPVAGILLKKGCRIFYVIVFLCSSASLRIPLILFEAASLGWRFTLTRFILNLLVVYAISLLINTFLSNNDKKNIYSQSST